MRDYKTETEKRTVWIRETVASAKAQGVIFGNSGGKDSALVAILCKMAARSPHGYPFDLLGVMMPCGSTVNYGADIDHAKALASAFEIENIMVDLTPCRDALTQQLTKSQNITPVALTNINPRLRMTTLYALGQSRGYLVAGTGNKSEYHMGYFTKWGDGAYDFNPIADLLATEVLEFLRFLGAPPELIDKPPSAGLFEGQTDESDMGISYAAIDRYIQTGDASPEDVSIISTRHSQTEHKRRPPRKYGG